MEQREKKSDAGEKVDEIQDDNENFSGIKYEDGDDNSGKG